jgi:L-ascorbate metabolism protein UlaG (beta-lactamase superfamily)
VGLSAVTVAWWGHATATVTDSGVAVLTDPFLGRRLGHLRRRRGVPPPLTARDADVVVISHLHMDHLHLPSLAAIAPTVPVVVPRGAPSAVRGLRRLAGRELVEVEPGDCVRVGAVSIRAVPALHDGRRWPGSRRQIPALGYVIEGRTRTYFAGDTDFYPDMPAAVGTCDIALLPVGGWGPGLGPGHFDPHRAAAALALLGARIAVPVHFGTLWPIGLDRVRPDEFLLPGRRFAELAGQRAPVAEVRELVPGQTVRFELPESVG